MCVESIVRIRSPLLALKDDGVEDLTDKIPTRAQFNSLEECLKPMMAIKDFSEQLQTDKKPMIHLAIFILMQLSSMSKSPQFQSSSKTTRAFVEGFEDNLKKRIKNFGRKVRDYCVGNFLHPAFKGSLLKKVGGEDSYERTEAYIKSLFAEPEPRASQDLFATEPSQPTGEGAQGGWVGFDLDTMFADEGAVPASQKDKTPIEVELQKWIELSPVIRDVNIDILGYWKVKSSELPLLGKLARNLLGLQMTSCSSERLFSEAGQVAGTKRPLLSTTQCERLVFIHENFDRLSPLITKWKTDIKQFTYPEEKQKDTEDEDISEVTDPGEGTSGSAQLAMNPPATLRFRRASSSPDPDDPAAMDMNLVETSSLPHASQETPRSPEMTAEDDFYEPGPFPEVPEGEEGDD